ncbi:MAG: c-type cytochrome, partial [Gemmatimonadota bacterium]
IANGMYGMILVEPKAGLPAVDHEYYVMQGEFYTRGKFGDPGQQPFDMTKAIDENPPYVVFNGAVGALTGDHSLKAKVGETVRLFIGNGGPSLASSFHVIGEIMDQVHVDGGQLVSNDVQTVMIPPGSASIVQFKVNAPGAYLLVDHAVFRAFNKGALAILDVTGPDDSLVYSGRTFEGIYRPEGSAIQTITTAADTELKATTVAERVEFGKRIFDRTCAACHQPDGRGIPQAFPPLAGSDFLNADKVRAIGVVLHGRSGPITVNGEQFDGVMPALSLTDEMTANVLTYVYSQWGNKGLIVTPAEVAGVRAKGAGATPK